ncbi:MAG: tetratricopeptide repeat protein [Bradymonadaceae bacterium]
MAIDRQKVRSSAQEHVRKGNWKQAIAEFEKLVEHDDSDVRSLLKLADLYTRTDQDQKAVETFERVGEHHAEQDFYEKAVAVYKQALRIDPHQCDLRFKVGQAYHRIGRMRDAVESFRKAHNCYDEKGNQQGQIRALEELVRLDREDVGVYIQLAETYAKAGRREDAVATFRDAASQLDEEGRLDEYLQVVKRVLYFDPEDRQLRKRVVGLHVDRDNYKKALKHLQVLFNDDPEDVGVLRNLARTFRALDRDEKAVLVLHKLADQYRDAERYERAERTLRKLLDIAPDDQRAKKAVREIRKKQQTRQPEQQQRARRSSGGGAAGGTDAQRPESGARADAGGNDSGSEAEDALEAVEFIDESDGSTSSGSEPTRTPESDGSSDEGRERKSTDEEFAEIAANTLDDFDPSEHLQAEGGNDETAQADEQSAEDEPESDVVDLSDSVVPVNQQKATASDSEQADADSTTAGRAQAGSTDESPAAGDGDETRAAAETEPSNGGNSNQSSAAEAGGAASSVEEAESTEELLGEVDVFLKYGLYDKARNLLAELYEDQPQNLDVLEKRVDLYEATDQSQAATATLLQMAELAQSTPARARQYVQRALEASDSPDQVRRRAEDLGIPLEEPEEAPPEPAAEPVGPEGGQPDEPSPGEQEPEKPEAAQTETEQPGRERDRRSDSWAGVSVDSLDLQNSDEAEEAMDNLFNDVQEEEREQVNIGSDDPAGEMAEIDFYIQQGLYDKAHEALEEFRRENPDHPGIDKRQYQIKMAKHGGEVEENPTGAHSLSDEFESVEVSEGEPADDTEAVDDPGDETMETSIELGTAYRDMGLYDEAIDELKKVVDDPETGPEARYHIAVCQVEKGDTHEAASTLADLLRDEQLSDDLRAAARQKLQEIDSPRV